MWFWLLMMVLGAVTLLGIVFSRLFWWSMAAAGVVWTIGTFVEVFLAWKDARVVGHPGEEKTSDAAPTTSNETPLNPEIARV